MKKSDLLPSDENLIEIFKTDPIKRNDDVLYFVSLLDSIVGPYSIALDGQWGSGKTFFVKQTHLILNAHNEFSQVEGEFKEHREEIKSICDTWIKQRKKDQLLSNLHICTYFDAWEHDADNNPIASLLYEISRSVSKEYAFDGQRNNIDIIANVLSLLSGRDYAELIKSLKAESITDETKEIMDLRSEINEYFEKLLPEHGDRLVILIDELDRCNPAYAVNLLEKIKHYFSNKKITFVFSVNMEQLQHTIKHHYGNNFNAYKYLDRFFDLIVPMPKLNQSTFLESLPYDTSTIVYQVASEFVKQYSMEMREIAKYYSSLNIATKYRNGHDDFSGGSKQVCFNFFIPIAIGLQKYSIDKYNDFINGKDAGPLINVLCSEELKHKVPGRLGIGGKHELKSAIQEIYDAIFIHSANGKRVSAFGFYYDDTVLSYFYKIVGLLNSTANFE